jgi:hypothetical protein
MRYFQLRDDMRMQGRWVLGEPLDELGQEVDPWQFEQGQALTPRGLFRLRPFQPGRAVDFSTAGVATPVIHVRFADLFARLDIQDEVQLFPAQVEGQTDPYFILNVLHVIRCIDDARCEEVRRYTASDSQPEKAGQYRNVVGLRIDPSRVGGSHIFRPWGWPVAMIVSERLNAAMEEAGVTGAKLTEV